MKKVYTVFSLVAAAGLSMAAQQLPNAGFEGEWEQSRPWNSVCGTDLSMDDALEAMGTFVEAPRYGGIVYDGSVVVNLGEPSDPIPAKVHIITDENNPAKCTLVLPDFSLGESATIGDIIVPEVSKTVKADRSGYTYEGFVRNLTLKMGEEEIHANVNVNGTTDNDGNAVFDIPVTWLIDYDTDPDSDAGIPIGVTFNGKTDTPDSAGISDVTVDDDNAPVEYFTLQGMRLSQPEAGQIVIRRQGSKVSKILVK